MPGPQEATSGPLVTLFPDPLPMSVSVPVPARRSSLLAPALLATLVGSAAALCGPPVWAQAAAAVQDEDGAAAAPGPQRWQLKVQAPGDLKALLERHLDLARYAEAANRDPAQAISRSELRRLVAATPAQARELLEAQGYFNAQVTAELGSERDKPEVQIQVNPGPLTRVQGVQIDFAGALSLGLERQEPQAQALAAQMRERFALSPDEPYTQDAWSSAKTGLLNALRAEGYALAALSGTSAQVDAQTNQARLFLFADSGPRLYIQSTRYEGLRHVDTGAVAGLLSYRNGEPLREQSLQDSQDRLVKTNLFDTVAVTVAPEVFENSDGSPATIDTSAERLDVPVTVKLRERAMQQATVGLGASDATGPRITFEHIHQDPFGLDWQSKIKLQLASQSRQVAVDLISHPLADGRRSLVSAALARTEATGLVVQSQTLRVGRTEDTPRQERLVYLQWERDRTEAASTGLPVDDTSAFTLNYHWIWRNLDNPILPTRGHSVLAEVGAGRSYHSDEDGGLFGRVHGRYTGYWPLWAAFFGQARVEAGQIIAPNRVAVPYTQLFRAGGDDSVRGYDYQGLGPSDANGNATGGRVLAAASLELARPISRKLPAFWWATFVDAGHAANNWQEYKPALGYGVGLRWRSPVGPLRIDLAYGDKVRRARLHFSVGITF